jgi:hypothetical protein
MVSVYITPSFKLSNAFADIVATSNITAGFSSTMLLLWFEFVSIHKLISLLFNHFDKKKFFFFFKKN